ncbi:hypothetical protein STEG23_022520 [Scotinomys teguina]
MISSYLATKAYDASVISSVLQSDSGEQPRAIAIDLVDRVFKGQVLLDKDLTDISRCYVEERSRPRCSVYHREPSLSFTYSVCFKQSAVVVHSLIVASGRQRLADLCEFEASLVYRASLNFKVIFRSFISSTSTLNYTAY